MRLLSAAVLLLALALAASTGAAPDDRPAVVSTIAQIGDVVHEIAGDRVDAVHLMGQGVDPHLYKPTRQDMAKLLRADLVLYNGLLLEGKMTGAFDRIRRSGKPVEAMAEVVPETRRLAEDGADGHPDPHVWMDVELWALVSASVRDELIAVDPDGRDDYEANAARYIERLEALDAWAIESMATIPEASRVLVTAHDAFGYLGARYGVDVVGIQGISTESEAGLRHIEAIVDLLVTQKIGAVFVESTVPDRNVKALIAGAKARGHEVVIGGELFSDAMGKPGTPEGTYVGMVVHNITTIVNALGGEVTPFEDATETP